MMCGYVVWQVFMLQKLTSGQGYKGRRTRGSERKPKEPLYLSDLDNVTKLVHWRVGTNQLERRIL